MSNLYLGHPAFEPRPFTRLDPSAQHEDGAWRAYGDWAAALPPDGRVFAPNLIGYREGDVIAFAVEPNRRAEPGRDEFVVETTQRVMEILDFREVGPETARRALVEVGLSSLVGGTDSVVAAISQDTCVVVKMVRHPTEARYLADIHGLEALALHRFDDRVFRGDRIRARWLSVPGVTIGNVAGRVDWCRDVDFLESVLKRLRKAVPQGTAFISKSQIPQLAAYLSRAELMPSLGDGLIPMLERLKTFGPELVANASAISAIVDTLSAVEPVETKIAAEIAARRSHMEREVHAEVELEMREKLRTDMAALEIERAKLEGEVALLAERAATGRDVIGIELAAFDEARAIVMSELGSVLETFGDAPPDVEASIASLTSRLARAFRSDGGTYRVLAERNSPWASPRLHRAEALAWSEMSEVLGRAARRTRFVESDLVHADVGARAGRMIVVPERDFDFVRCYAEVVAGEAPIRHALDPSVLGLDDLWLRPAGGAPTGFAKAWTAARFDPRRYRVLLLDGLHRTPFDLWLPSLLDVLAGDERPSNLLVFTTLGDYFLDDARVWKGLAEAGIGISPRRSAADSGDVARLLRDAPPETTSFDPTCAPQPSKAEVLDLIDLAYDLSPIDRAHLVRAYRAAWPHSGLDRGAIAMALAGVTIETSGANADGLTAGREWLRDALQPQSGN